MSILKNPEQVQIQSRENVGIELVACVVLEERTDVLHDATVELVQGDVRFGRNRMLFKADVNDGIFVGTHGEETSPNGGGLVWAMKVGEAESDGGGIEAIDVVEAVSQFLLSSTFPPTKKGTEAEESKEKL